MMSPLWHLAFQIVIDFVKPCFYIFIGDFIEIQMVQQPFSSCKCSILISDISCFLVSLQNCLAIYWEIKYLKLKILQAPLFYN